jgi:site-specific recombinase XerD
MFQCSRPEYSEVLDTLCRHMSLKGCVESTQISYVRAVRDLMEDIGKLPLACTEQEIIKHLTEVRDRNNLSSSSLNLRICALKYLYREVYRRLDIIVDLPNPRRPRLEGDILTEEEVIRLFDGVRSIKHLAVLHLLYDTGLRVRELAHLRVGDFNSIQGVLTVRHGKGDKVRVIPYGQQTRETLNEYFRQEKPVDALFTGAITGEMFTIRSVQYIVKQALKRSGLHKRVHPHTLRHSFAVHYLNNGGSLLRLQQLLGHTQISTTLIYLRYAAIPLREVATPLDFLTGKRRP